MKKRHLISLLLCLLFLKPASADVAGAEISYACTATPGIFEITLVLYTECSGLPLCAGSCGTACTQNITIKGVDSGYTTTIFGTVTVSLVNVRDMDQIPGCPTAKSTCTNMGCTTAGTFTLGYERYEFKGLADIGSTSGIPATCCYVRFAYDGLIRSAQIQTGAASQNLYIDAIINRCHSVSPCNSSPTYTNDAFGVFCGGEQAIYNGAAVDPDHDSLSFAFAPALQDFGVSVTYISPWSYDRPLPWTGFFGAFPSGIWCDSDNGDIRFTPANAGGSNFTGVLTTEVKQWKRIGGVATLMGVTRREIQTVILANCASNNPPRFITNPPEGTNPNAPKTYWEVCEGQQLCFTITSKDTDYLPTVVSDTTYLQWDGNLSALGATFTPTYDESTRHLTGPREASYQFCWTPPVGSASNTPYLMTVKTNDTKCPIPGRSLRAFRFRVVKPATLSIVKNSLGCGKFTIGYSVTTPGTIKPITKLRIAKVPFDTLFASGSDTFMNVTSSPELIFTTPGKYLIQLSQTNYICSEVLYDTLVVDTLLQAVAINDTFVCNGNSITLNAIAKYGSAPYTYRWFNSINDTSLLPLNAPTYLSSNYTITPTSSKTYTVQILDFEGCISYDSVFVMANKGVKNTVLSNSKCNGLNNGSIVMNMLDTVMPFQYSINSGTYQSSNQFTSLAPGIYSVEAKDTNNCSITTSGLTLTQPEILRDTLTRVVNNQTCFGLNNGQLTTTGKGGTAPYRYSLDSSVFKSTGTFTSLAPATYKVFILDSNNCYLTVTQTIVAADSLYHITSTQNPSCFGKNNGEIRTQGVGGTPPYIYRLGVSGPYLNDSIFENLVAGTYYINVRDHNACSTIFTKTIIAPTRLLSSSNTTNTSCFGTADGTAILHSSGGTPPYQYREGTTGVLSSDSLFTNLAAGNHKLYTVDNQTCLDSVTITINQPVQTKATLGRTNPSCFGKADGRIIVNTTQGRAPFQYTLNSGTFGSSNTFNNLGGNSYSVTVKDSNGCLLSLSTTLSSPPQIVAGNMSGNTTVLQNITETYSIAAQAGLSYVWGIQKGHIISGQFTNSVNVIWDSIGTGQIGVAIYSDTTCGDTTSLSVNIGFNGLHESAKLIGLEVYPNPTSGLLNITLKTLPENRSLKLYDINGRLIVEQELKQTQQLNLETLPQGIYLLKVGDYHGQIIKK